MLSREEIKEIAAWYECPDYTFTTVATIRRLVKSNLTALDLLDQCEKALAWEDKRCGRVYGPLGEALAAIKRERGVE